MATVASFNVALIASTGRFTAAMSKAERQWNQFARNVQRGSKQLPKSIAAVTPASLAMAKHVVRAAAVAGAALSALGGVGVKLAMDFEEARVAFTTFFGDARKADRFVRQLEIRGRRTPFGFAGLQESARSLLAFGYTAEQVLDMIEPLGDAVAAMGGGQDTFEQIARALGQMKAKGKVSGEELLQLAEAGVPAYQFLAEEIGTSIPQAMEMAQRGAIPVARAIDAIITGMRKRFAGAMAAQMQTNKGFLRGIRESTATIARGFGEDIIRIIGLRAALQRLNQALGTFADLVSMVGFMRALERAFPPWMIPIIVGIAGAIAGALVPAIVAWLIPALKKLGVTLWASLAPLWPWMLAGAALAGIAYLLTTHWNGFRKLWQRTWQLVVAFGYWGAAGVVRGVSMILSALSLVVPSLRETAQAVRAYADHLWAAGREAFEAALATAQGAQNLAETGQEAAQSQQGLSDALAEAAKQAQDNLQSFDEVHQLQDEMAATEFEIPEVPVPEIPGLPAGGFGAGLGAITEEDTSWVDRLVEKTRGMFEAIGNAVATVGDYVERARQSLGKLGDMATQIGQTIRERWADAVAYVSEIWSGLEATATRWAGQVRTVVSDAWTGLVQSTQDSWTQIKTTLEAVWNGLGVQAESVWASLKGAAAEAWQGIAIGAEAGWAEISRILEEHWPGITARAETTWAVLKATAAETWQALAIGAEAGWGDIRRVLDDAWAAISTGSDENWRQLAATLGEIWSNICAGARAAWDPVGSMLSNLWASITANAQLAWAGVGNWLRQAWEGIKAAAGNVWDALAGVVSSTWSAISTATNTAWSAISAWLASVWDGIKSAASTAWSAVSGVVSDVWDSMSKAAKTAWSGLGTWLADTWRGISATAQQIWDGIPKALQQAVDSAVRFAQRMAGDVGTAVQGMKDQVVSFVKKMVDDVVTWLGSLATRAVEAVKGWTQSVIDKIRQMYVSIVGGSIVPDMAQQVLAWFNKMKASGSGIVNAFANDLVAIFAKACGTTVEKLGAWAGVVQNVMQSVATGMESVMMEAFNGIINRSMTMGEAFQHVLSGMGDVVKQVLVQQLAQAASQALAKLGAWVMGVVANAATAVVAFIQQAYAALVAFFAWAGPLAPVLAGGVIAAAIAGIAALASQLSGIVGLAEGGIVTGPTLAMMGEGGRREAVIPLERDNVIADSVGQAVYEAMTDALQFAQASGHQSEQREIVLRIDGATFARLILPHMIRESQRQGMQLALRPQGV